MSRTLLVVREFFGNAVAGPERGPPETPEEARRHVTEAWSAAAGAAVADRTWAQDRNTLDISLAAQAEQEDERSRGAGKGH